MTLVKLHKICALVGFLTAVQWCVLITGKLPVCSKSNEGKTKEYRKNSGDDGILACVKNAGKYVWKFLDGSPTLGEQFDPASTCSDIVDNVVEAKNGFFWIRHGKNKISKVWCDVDTDGGGFMLIGMKNSPITWNVRSSDTVVRPTGPPQWSSQFGDMEVEDFAVQISTSEKFKDTKAHWSYRLKSKRTLGSLFGVGSGGCTDVHSGIGNVRYVKDILTETVVNKNFNCSKFGPHTSSALGWARMNYCLKNKCPDGFAFLPGYPVRLDNYGSFSYSSRSPISGITHDATAFVGCDNKQCCACFGPKGGRSHYCGKKCTSINGGTVVQGKVYVWFWIRTRVSKRVWKRCMEFQMKNEAGKMETYFIDKQTGTARKGSCANDFDTFLNEGTILVKDKESLENLPNVPGLLAYRKDNNELYVNKGNSWDAVGSKNKTNKLNDKLNLLEKNLKNLKKVDTELETKIKNLENRLNASIRSGKSCKDIQAKYLSATSGIYWIRLSSKAQFQVYCDMETYGGGWTLVYSYTFTNYDNFDSGSNAVTPRPSWPASGANVPISKIPPLNESSRGAVDYSLWKDIGKEILIKSNINDWIVCQPNGGSLVTNTNGALRCQNKKNVATKCTRAPTRITWYSDGPGLSASYLYYVFDGATSYSWPTHDPCGLYQTNHKKGVSSPGGAIFLR